MILVAVAISLCLLPYIISVKLVIDGTIDFGPSWKFENIARPFRSFEPGPTIAIRYDDKADELTDEIDAKIDEENKEFINEFDNSVTHGVETENENVDISSLREDLKVTRFFELKTAKNKNKNKFINPRKIKNDEKITNFIAHIHNSSLKVFNRVEKDTRNNEIVAKIKELKQTFGRKYGQFFNETLNHYIKTALGEKKVIFNAIDYSHKLLERLSNRLKIDIKEGNLRNKDSVVKTLKEDIERSVKEGYEEACRKFKVCRTRNEFSDFLTELLTIVSKGNDVKMEQLCKAVAKEMKNAKFNRIMDEATTRAFKDKMSLLEELGPSELRFILFIYVTMIESKNLPIVGKVPQDLENVLALFNIIETFDQNVKITDSNKVWADRMKKDVNDLLSNKGLNSTDIAKTFVKHIQDEVINKFDDKTATELKSNFRKMLLHKTPPHDAVYVPYQFLFYS